MAKNNEYVNTKSDQYWEERFTNLEEKLLNRGEETLDVLEIEYNKSIKGIENKLLVWYQRLADNNGISLADAKRWLDEERLEEFKWTVDQYIEYGKANVLNQMWIEELENASAKVHITELEEMQIHLRHQVEKISSIRATELADCLEDVYEDGYYNTLFELQTGLGAGAPFEKLKQDDIEAVLAKPWNGGRTFSEKIWGDRDTLVNTLETKLTQSIIRGDAPDEMIRTISKEFNVSKSSAGRLVMTESSYFAAISRLKGYKEMGVEKYKVSATLDLLTSEICREMDGTIFDIEDYLPGVTANPFHPWCRTTTIPYFGESNGTRIARGSDGKNYSVSVAMTYQEWHKKYVEDNPEELLKEKKQKNYIEDAVQYKRYKQLLGEFITDSFDEFQNIKYSDKDEYSILKEQYRGIMYYNQAVSNEPTITKVVKQIADDTGMDMLGFENRIKTKESYLTKIRTNHNSGKPLYADEIKDIIRYTYGAKPNDLAEKVLDSIDKYSELGYNTVRVRNKWIDTYDPYNGINAIIQSPTGQKFELQYHTKESFELKNGEMHELYKQQENIKDKMSKEYIELRNKMFDLSDQMKIPKNIERVK